MDQSVIIKYLLGKTSEEESKGIIDWLKDKENEDNSFRLLSDIWKDAELSLVGEKPDFEKWLEKIRKEINIREKKSARIARWGIFYRSFSRVAAVLIVPLFILTVYLFLAGNFNPEQKDIAPVEHEIYTKAGTRTRITLGDGTIVWLHDGTKFRYPEKFGKDSRQVFVDGEAFFEVAKNPKRPFIVDNPMMKTMVTGTKFNLNAYSSDSYFEATLVEGKVELQHEKQRYNLTPGQQIRYDPESDEVTRLDVDPSISSSWIDGRLILQDEPLGIAVKKLSRWYNIDIVMQDPELENFLLTATIYDEKPEQTFRLISLAIPVDYSVKTIRTGNTFRQIFYLKKR